MEEAMKCSLDVAEGKSVKVVVVLGHVFEYHAADWRQPCGLRFLFY